MSCKYRLIIAGLGAVLSVTAMSALGQDKTETPKTTKLGIILSKETTYITGPVNEDGTVNYVAYLNEKYSKGVTPQNNAAIDMFKVFGPDIIPESVRAKAYKTLKMKPLPEKGNYFVTFQEFRNKRSSNKYDHDAWLKANKVPLDALVTAASMKTRYYFPLLTLDEPSIFMQSRLPNLQGFRRATEALVARAENKADLGDTTGAWSDVLAVGCWARLLSQGPHLIGRLVGIAFEEKCCEAIPSLIQSSKLTEKQAKGLLSIVDSMRPLPDIREAMANERYVTLDSVMVLAGKRLPADTDADAESTKFLKYLDEMSKAGKIDWNIVLRTCNKWFDEAEAVAAAKTPHQRKAADDRFYDEMEDMREALLKLKPLLQPHTKKGGRRSHPIGRAKPIDSQSLSEAVGKMTVSLLLPSLNAAVTLQERSNMHRDLVRLALALAAEKARTGKYPAKLSALSPRYLKTIPKDIFSGKELIYKPVQRGRECLLYSVGENLKDDGGKDEDEDQDDLIVRGY